jgi:uncharacterized membrane protein
VNSWLYFALLALLVFGVLFVEKKSKSKFFNYIPSVVIIYIFSMFFASFGAFHGAQIEVSSDLAKRYILPAMLFLMLLQVDIRDFVKLSKKLLIAYVLSVASIVFAFVVVVWAFAFNSDMAGAFGALLGSWTGGMANMVAVGTALGVSKEAFGFTLIVDSINYTIWISFLLFLTPFASRINRFFGSNGVIFESVSVIHEDKKKHYIFMLLLSMLVSMAVVYVAQSGFVILNFTTTTVVLATIMGIIFSWTKLSSVGGSNFVGSLMLYFLIALIGSGAMFESFDGIMLYVFAGFCILLLHALIMLLGAKLFKLDLFSIAVASLANIGGVASASILAATYDKKLVGVGVLMAVMGFVIGTFVGIGVGEILVLMAK